VGLELGLGELEKKRGWRSAPTWKGLVCQGQAKAFSPASPLGQWLVNFTHPKGGVRSTTRAAIAYGGGHPVDRHQPPQPKHWRIWPVLPRRPGIGGRHHSEFFFRRHGAAPAGSAAAAARAFYDFAELTELHQQPQGRRPAACLKTARN